MLTIRRFLYNYDSKQKLNKGVHARKQYINCKIYKVLLVSIKPKSLDIVIQYVYIYIISELSIYRYKYRS